MKRSTFSVLGLVICITLLFLALVIPHFSDFNKVQAASPCFTEIEPYLSDHQHRYTSVACYNCDSGYPGVFVGYEQTNVYWPGEHCWTAVVCGSDLYCCYAINPN